MAFDVILDALPYFFIIVTIGIIAKDTSSIFLNKLLTMIFIGFFFFLTACVSFCFVAAFYTFIEVEDIILEIFTAFVSYCSQLLFTVILLCDIRFAVILSFSCNLVIMLTSDFLLTSCPQMYIHFIVSSFIFWFIVFPY